MREVPPYSLWLGTAADRCDVRAMLDAGIAALVDLALNEPPVPVTRELVYCRFPLVDGHGNPPWLLRVAIETTASLLRTRTPTLIGCGAGMSRSPVVAAAALAVVRGQSPQECLAEMTRQGPCDLSSGLWRDVCEALSLAQAAPAQPR